MSSRADQVADELYGLHPSVFVATRDERAREATTAGDREAAKEIRKLRRPSTSAWLVNMLQRERPDDMAELGELGEALRSAQASLAGDDLRELAARRRTLVDRLVPQARALAGELGHPASETVLAELQTTLQAALVDADAAAAVGTGRLTAAVQAGGAFGFGFGAAPPRAEPSGEQTPPTDLRLARVRKELEKALAAQETAERTAATRRREATAADDQLASATAHAEQAAEALRVAEAQRADAEQRAAAAHDASTTADADLAAARTRVTEARSALDDAGSG